MEASSQSSPPQRRPDTHPEETYASVVSDSRQPQCVYPAAFLQNRLLMRDKMSPWPVQPLQMTSTEQHSVGPSSVSSSIATGRHDTDNMVNITDINTTVNYDNSICNITPDISDQSNSGHPLQLKQDFFIVHHNVSRLYNKLDEIKLDQIKIHYSVTIYCCSETFLNDNISDHQITIEGYNIIRREEKVA